FDVVAELVAPATGARARELLGGNPAREAPRFFYPTPLAADIDPGNLLVVEEQFDPALPIVMYSTVDAAIQLANGLETGLGSSVWGTDCAATLRVTFRLEAGTTWINVHGGVDLRIPFGGAKQSGYGLEFGPMASSNLASHTSSSAKQRTHKRPGDQQFASKPRNQCTE